jgi:hypothetical protein
MIRLVYVDKADMDSRSIKAQKANETLFILMEDLDVAFNL